MARQSKAKDRVGQTLHKLNIIDYKFENSKQFYYVECLLCGSKKWMRVDRVISKKNDGCGCYSPTRFKVNNLIGKKFDRLTAIECIREKKEHRGNIWKCQCECGNIINVSASDLLSGRVKSCGCLAKDHHYNRGKELSEWAKTSCSVDGTNPYSFKTKIPKNNTSGVKGVIWDKKRGMWRAQIVFKGKNYYLGRYSKKEDAIKARKKAENSMFGEFLKWYYENYKKEKNNGNGGTKKSA